MPSRRRRRSKNLGTNLAEVQRRLRYLERRPVRTKLQNRVVTTSSIAVNAVTSDEAAFGTTVITSEPVNTIENPKDGLLVINETAGTTSVYSAEQNDYIQLPAVDDEARTVALGKNTIYYQNSAPTGGTYAVDDTWFDIDDGYKMYTWTGSTWSGFQLGNSAIASISAQKITAGTLAAGVIVSSSIAAGQISAGTLNSGVIVSSSISANQISAGTISATISIQGPTITGGLLRTDSSGRRIEITDSDDIIFYNNSGRSGTLTSIGGTFSGGGDDPYTVTAGVMLYGGANTVSQGGETYPSIIASATDTFMYGDSRTRVQVGAGLVGVYGYASNLYSDVTTIFSGYSTTPSGTPWHTSLIGRLVFSENSEGPLSSGTGQPTTNGVLEGQIVFRYT